VAFVELTGGIVILWVGGYNVITGELSIGQLITFNSLMAYFLDPVKNLINLQPQMQTAIVAADRLGEILDLEPERLFNEEKKLEPESLKGSIILKNVTFRYGTRKPVLVNINIHIKQGERIALVGESGSGKTTLSKLLLNLYSPESGDILINNNNIKDIKLEILREKIAYIPQETFLFSGSIIENLTLGLDDVTIEEVIEASKRAQVHEFINELPLRYETRLEENGTNLSGGQRQRLAIARAILKKPDILILDEATSNLDSITEGLIEKMVREFSENITTITIAHRLSTIKKCDMIYVLDKGRIIEKGNHEQLLKLDRHYAKLCKQQEV
jgi:ATP-binding cassette subfamily B protein